MAAMVGIDLCDRLTFPKPAPHSVVRETDGHMLVWGFRGEDPVRLVALTDLRGVQLPVEPDPAIGILGRPEGTPWSPMAPVNSLVPHPRLRQRERLHDVPVVAPFTENLAGEYCPVAFEVRLPQFLRQPGEVADVLFPQLGRIHRTGLDKYAPPLVRGQNLEFAMPRGFHELRQDPRVTDLAGVGG